MHVETQCTTVTFSLPWRERVRERVALRKREREHQTLSLPLSLIFRAIASTFFTLKVPFHR